MSFIIALAIMLLSAGLGLFIAYRALRAEIDTHPVRRQIKYGVIGLVGMLALLAAVSLLLAGPTRRHAWELVLGVITAVLWGFLGWLVAGLWSGGRVLVRLPRPPRQWLFLVSVAAFSLHVLLSLHREETVIRAFYLAAVLSLVVCYLLTVVVPPALREHGLIFVGMYLPWRYVRGWEWEGVDGLTLTLLRRRTPATVLVYWYPRLSLHIPHDRKGEVERLLRERVPPTPSSPVPGIGGVSRRAT